MIAIDWSHTKELTTYDGKKVRIESLQQLCKRLDKDGESNRGLKSTHKIQPSEVEAGGESTFKIKSKYISQPPALIFEAGVPLSIAYRCILAGAQVFQLDNKAVAEYREAEGIEKTDENDAKIIYELANNEAKLMPLNLDDKLMQLHDLYHQYRRYQKARVAMQNMKKAHQRQYRGWESNPYVKTIPILHQPLDLLPYDIAIETLQAREKGLIKRIESEYKGLPLFERLGGESIDVMQSSICFQPPSIKGLGTRLWLGILITANPSNFKCLSAYLRYCGLTNDVIKTHKYNRHARTLYHMLAEEVMKLRDPRFRAIYDKCKEDIKEKYPDYTKGHIHNAALNRTATALAKTIYRSVRGESRDFIQSTIMFQPRTASLAGEN